MKWPWRRTPRSWDDISSVTGKYWLWREDRQQWEEVSRDEYMAAEKAAGFNAPAGRVSTAAFANGQIRGTTILPRRPSGYLRRVTQP